MAGNIPYIGSKISMITTSDIRYEGILHTLNVEESTIAVQSVRSFGTEGRRVPEVPMSNEIYDFIVFRGKDLKDLKGSDGQNCPDGTPRDVVDLKPTSNAISHPETIDSDPHQAGSRLPPPLRGYPNDIGYCPVGMLKGCLVDIGYCPDGRSRASPTTSATDPTATQSR